MANRGGGSGAMGRGSTNPAGSGARPEHLFSCPPSFLELAELYTAGVSSKQAVREDVGDLEGKASASSGGVVDLSVLAVNEKEGRAQEGEAGVRWTCNGCRATFHSLEEQRSHFKSDYHRLNVKRKVAGKEPLNEEEFEAVVEGQEKGVNDDLSSISGSDDESDDPDQTASQMRLVPRAGRIYFVLPDFEEILSLWRPVVIGEREYLEGEKGSGDSKEVGELCVRDDRLLLRLKALIPSGSENEGHSSQKSQIWMILLAAGGHFAGVVVNMKGAEVLAHHTFHRYVVRAKAGGRQSTQDKSGRAPKSAGASLRRYNEAALQNEIRDLLTTWGGHLRSASHIFVHAPSANGQALFGGENAPLNSNDLRIRRIPFTTRRPTFKEAKRVHHVLTTIFYEDESTISHSIKLANRLVDGRKDGARKGLKTQESQIGKTKESFKGGTGAAGSSSTSVAELSSSDGLEPAGSTAQREINPLHQAAKSGNSELVLKLLEDGLDPCVKDEGGYTPYARAQGKDTRNVFRRFMAGHPDLWDWHEAKVPSALTEEMEAAQSAKQAEKDMKRKEREKEKKKLRKEELRVKEAEKKAADLAAAALANVRGTGPLKKASKEAAGYEEALLKAQAQEREIRAAAAEQRMKAMIANKESQMQAGNSGSSSVTAPRSCSCCGDSLVFKNVFSRLTYEYCSTICVQVHRKYLESE